MSPKTPRVFHYNGCAHAFSGFFTRPFQQTIDIQAATSLPIIGGHGNSRVDCFQFREFVSFKSGYSHVTGAHQADDDSNNTLVTSVVEGLNIMDVLTADRVICRIYSKHPADQKEGSITITGSRFENLRIAGHPVHVDLDFELFNRISTFEAARKEFAKKGEFSKIASDPLRSGKSISTPDENGTFLCSAVKEMDTDCPGVKRTGHCFYVHGFGKVYLAEMMIKHGERSLTMLRLELGSSVSGGGTVSGGKANGSHWP